MIDNEITLHKRPGHQMTQKLSTIGHCTALNNEQSPDSLIWYLVLLIRLLRIRQVI